MAEIDRCQTVIDVNNRVAALAEHLGDEDRDALLDHAGVRRTELGAK
ncbi:hypothetical protein [Sphingobium amiense]|nr:hypothetical protein [Sphingobium amiense]